MTEQRFALTKAPLGRRRGGVVVGDALVRFEHPLLRQSVTIPPGQIAAVVRPSDPSPVPVLARDVRVLGLVANALKAPNLLVVLRSPTRFATFKLGADRFFAISARERRRGVDIDVVGVAVDDPDGLTAALAAMGVPTSTSLVDTLTAVVPAATGPQLDDRIRVGERRARHARLIAVATGLGGAALLSARLSVGPTVAADVASTLRMAGVAMAGAIAVGAVVSPAIARLGPAGPEASSARRVAVIGSALVSLAVILAVLWRADRWAGVPYVLAHAALGALGGGWLVAVAALGVGSVPASWGPAPVDPPGGARVRGWVPWVGVAAAAVVGVVAVLEPSVAGDLAIARKAVVTVGDLPPGWVQCCGEAVYRGSELDGHICGSDDEALPAHTAGFDREFSYNLTSEGFEDGHLVEAVFLAPTEADARRELAAVDSSGYEPCALASVARSARISVPKAVGEPRVIYERGELPGGAPGIVDRFITTFAIPGGSDVVFTAFVRMRIGRAIVRMPIQTYDAPLSEAGLQPIVAVAVAKLTAALGAGATAGKHE